jgi:hypothetical protein
VVSLAGLRHLLAEGAPAGRGDEDSVRRQWWAALATLQEDLLTSAGGAAGLWLAAPLPALYEPGLLRRLRGWVWAPAAIEALLQPGAPLLPGRTMAAPSDPGGPGLAEGFQRLPLQEADGTDPLLVLITERLQVALALDGPTEARRLLVRFDAPVLSAALELLDALQSWELQTSLLQGQPRERITAVRRRAYVEQASQWMGVHLEEAIDIRRIATAIGVAMVTPYALAARITGNATAMLASLRMVFFPACFST